MEIPSPKENAKSPTTSNGSTTAAANGPLTPTLTPTKPIARSNETTTFVQADTNSFKKVVQMLTGSDTKQQPSNKIPPINSTGQMKRHGFKLYERRNSLKNGLMINTLSPEYSMRPEILSPGILDFPALALSPLTPLNSYEEERAIAEKKFYLHPSPRGAAAAGGGEPELLPLFPVTSPRVSGFSS